MKSLPRRIMEQAGVVWPRFGQERLFGKPGFVGPAFIVILTARSTDEPWTVWASVEGRAVDGPNGLDERRPVCIGVAAVAGPPTHANCGAHGGGPITSRLLAGDHSPVLGCVPEAIALLP